MTTYVSTVWNKTKADQGNHATERKTRSGYSSIEGRTRTETAEQRNKSQIPFLQEIKVQDWQVVSLNFWAILVPKLSYMFLKFFGPRISLQGFQGK